MPATARTQRYTTDNSLILLVDHQTGTVDWVKSLPKATVIASTRADRERGSARTRAAALLNGISGLGRSWTQQEPRRPCSTP